MLHFLHPSSLLRLLSTLTPTYHHVFCFLSLLLAKIKFPRLGQLYIFFAIFPRPWRGLRRSPKTLRTNTPSSSLLTPLTHNRHFRGIFTSSIILPASPLAAPSRWLCFSEGPLTWPPLASSSSLLLS